MQLHEELQEMSHFFSSADFNIKWKKHWQVTFNFIWNEQVISCLFFFTLFVLYRVFCLQSSDKNKTYIFINTS